MGTLRVNSTPGRGWAVRLVPLAVTTLTIPSFFFLMTRRPPRSPLFPSPTLFRSHPPAARGRRKQDVVADCAVAAGRRVQHRPRIHHAPRARRLRPDDARRRPGGRVCRRLRDVPHPRAHRRPHAVAHGELARRRPPPDRPGPPPPPPRPPDRR